jgi:SAM-dependent methyltransferase
MTSMKCRICDNEIANKKYKAKEMMFGYRDIHHYFECSKCGCLQIVEVPSNLSRYYGPSYYAHRIDRPSSKIKKYFVRSRNKYALFKKGLIGKFLLSKFPTKQFDYFQTIKTFICLESRILEIGCGSGSHLKSLYEIGFKHLLGIDPYADNDVNYKNGLIIKKQDIKEIHGTYDLALFHHSFEHCIDPLGVLKSVFDLLITGGTCVIRMPTASSYAWKHYGVNWAQLDAPRHFYLHTVESMLILSCKTGFELSGIIYDSTAFQFWGSEQFLKDIPLMDDRSLWINPQSTIFSKKDMELFIMQADELNSSKQGDQAIFYLRKADKSPN